MRVRFFYGWVVIAVAFVTMGIGVNARTAFSLLYAPILDEFGWERGLTAGAFSVGFFVSAVASPFLGALMDRWGPRGIILLGVLFVGGGMALAPLVHAPWHLYLALGLCVSGGSLALGYTGHALFLPNWFVRRRGLAIGLAFSGVGVGSIVLLPWMQTMILRVGWRHACVAMAILLFVPAEIFHGRQYATIFAILSVASTAGAGLGPWVAGALYDRTGSYVLAFWIAMACSVVSAVAIWLSPGRVRTVAGRTPRAARVTG